MCPYVLYIRATEGKNEKLKKRRQNEDYLFLTQYDSSLCFVPNFRILTQVVAEKIMTEKCPYVLYIRVTEGKMTS